MKHKFNFKNSFCAFGKHLWLFIKRLTVFAFYWGMFAIISYGIAVLIPITLRSYLHIDPAFCTILSKILFTLAPLFPTLIYTQFEKEDINEEFSMDLCFAVWIFTIIWTWFLA